MSLIRQCLLLSAAFAAFLLTGCGPEDDLTYACGKATVSAFAGTPEAGNTDGTGTSAQFDFPTSLATDGVNLYVADFSNNSIRQIVLSTGAVTTLAGSGTNASVDGTGQAASFSGPAAVVTDGTNLYVADAGGNRIRQIVIATGEVTTLAGSGAPASVDGTGTGAAFDSPFGLAIYGPNLYVGDADGHKIRKIVIATGEVTTIAGTGSIGDQDAVDGLQATFRSPVSLATDGVNLYVADSGKQKIRQIVLATGAVTTLAGSNRKYSKDGTGKEASFKSLAGLALADGNLYVADGTRLRKVVIATGEVTTLAGSDEIGYATGLGSAAQFGYLTGIAVDAANSTGVTLYVADALGNSIRGVNYVYGECPVEGKHTVGGTVTGLNGGGSVVLLNNGGDSTTVSANGVFSLTSSVTTGQSYNVTVGTQPAGQFCAVTNGSGTVSANVTNIAVTCTNNAYAISGIVNGLSSVGLVLRNNGGDDLSVFPSGMNGMSFTFTTAVTQGNPYSVTILSQPATETCSVTSGGSGTVTSTVSDVVIDCVGN